MVLSRGSDPVFVCGESFYGHAVICREAVACEEAPPRAAAAEDLVTGGDVGAHSARQAVEVQGEQGACSVFCAGCTYRVRREEVQVICQGDVAVTEAAAGEPGHDVCPGTPGRATE